jgi:hypothetical protein
MSVRYFDVVVLARRINLRLQQFRALHPDRAIGITPAMSRILENDPDYIPYRVRVSGKKRAPSTNPSIATLAQIAASLGTTVGDLLGEPWPLSPAERALFIDTIAVIDRLLARNGYRRERKPQ